MSMLFSLRRVPKDEASSLIREPSDISFFLDGNESSEPPRSFIQKLFGSKREPKPQREWVQPDEDTVLDLYKNWHLLHYLLSRTPWEGPMPQASLMGGVELGKVDVGYGPARLLVPQQIEAFLNYLGSLNENEFGSDVTASELEENEIYGAYPEWNPAAAKELWGYIGELKSFFSKAKSAEESIILYLY